MKQKLMAVLCGVVTMLLICCIIPLMFMRAVEDLIWGALMIIFPAAAAVIMMHIAEKCPLRYVLLSLLTEWIIIVVFGRHIGGFLGYRLQSFEYDLFDYIAYYMFAGGMCTAATFAQLAALWVAGKIKK